MGVSPLPFGRVGEAARGARCPGAPAAVAVPLREPRKSPLQSRIPRHRGRGSCCIAVADSAIVISRERSSMRACCCFLPSASCWRARVARAARAGTAVRQCRGRRPPGTTATYMSGAAATRAYDAVDNQGPPR